MDDGREDWICISRSLTVLSFSRFLLFSLWGLSNLTKRPKHAGKSICHSIPTSIHVSQKRTSIQLKIHSQTTKVLEVIETSVHRNNTE